MLVVQKKIKDDIWESWAICSSPSDVMATFRICRRLGYVVRLRRGIEVL